MKFIGKFSIVLGAVFLVSGILASLIFFASFDWNDLDESDYFTYLNQKANFSVQGIKGVHSDFVSEDITVEEISGDEFVFNLQGYYPKNNNGEYPELKVEKIGDSLDVHVEFPQKRYIFGINSRKSNLYVGFPENYSSNFKIDVASGDVFVNGVVFDDFEVDAVSGEIELTNLEFLGDSFIETSSGNIDIKNLSCENFNVRSVSGEISIRNSEGINFVKTSSGDISMSGLKIKNNLDIESVSGEVDLGLVGGSSVDVEFESVSGDFDNDFGNVHDGNYEVYVKTSSGDLRVY